MKETWKIPVTWEACGTIEVPKDKFPTLKGAMEYVASDESICLPKGEYVDSSFCLTHEMNEIEEVREIYNDGEEDPHNPKSEKEGTNYAACE